MGPEGLFRRRKPGQVVVHKSVYAYVRNSLSIRPRAITYEALRNAMSLENELSSMDSEL